MGAVYLVIDRRTGQELALKLLRPELGTVPDLRRRFRRETRAISALDHPNIVRVVEVGELEVEASKLGGLELELPEDHRPTERGAFLTPPKASGQTPNLAGTLVLPFLAMEWLPGQDLGAVIDERPDLDRALALARQILSALDAAHRHGIVHRDLKPANVRVTPDGRVKLLDFGLAKLMPAGGDRETTSHLTLEGTVMGTLPYLAPEQLRGDRAGPRADLFAFGVLLYELLAGKPPYPGDSMVAYARALLTGTPPKLVDEAPQVPEWLGDLVGRLIAVDADERPASAAQVLAALEPTRPLPRPAPSTRPPPWRRVLPWLFLALISALIAGALVTLSRSDPGAAATDGAAAPVAPPGSVGAFTCYYSESVRSSFFRPSCGAHATDFHARFA